jgi:peptidoglycan hydrolase-like protein with peptidoglycan-binding domain
MIVMHTMGGRIARLPTYLSLVLLAVVAAVSALAGPAAAAPTAASQPVAASTVAARPTIKYGSRGSAVTYLQQRLIALRYDVGSVDGVFGSNTLHAVYAFQKVQGIGVDGVVGPTTWSRLASPYRPKARYYHSSAAVEINLTKRVLYLTKAGAVTRIVDASPGKSSTPTPTGNFSITRRIDGWRQSDLGLLWRPNYFYRGYAIHGSKSVPTYSASHGCVRVTISAMNRLWSVLYIGERVHVYR